MKNILAMTAGLILGGFLNSVIVRLNGTLIPLPDGADISTFDGLSQSMSLFKPVHFLAPFLAHALGTLVASWISVRFSVTPNLVRALIPGFVFLTGGAIMVMDLDAPHWFEAIDLVWAYLPMAWIGFKLGTLNKK
ncbi:MAG: hypothetical protein ACKOKB_11610 [Bacteroidota bacterium]